MKQQQAIGHHPQSIQSNKDTNSQPVHYHPPTNNMLIRSLRASTAFRILLHDSTLPFLASDHLPDCLPLISVLCFMQMKLVLHNGPVIPRVQSVSLDTGALAVTFLTPTAASIAHLATGWPFTRDDRTLLLAITPLFIHPPQDPAADRRSIAGWTLAEDSAPAVQ